MGGAEDAVGEIVGDESFVVVGEDQRVEIFERGGERAEEAAFGFGDRAARGVRDRRGRCAGGGR